MGKHGGRLFHGIKRPMGGRQDQELFLNMGALPHTPLQKNGAGACAGQANQPGITQMQIVRYPRSDIYDLRLAVSRPRCFPNRIHTQEYKNRLADVYCRPVFVLECQD